MNCLHYIKLYKLDNSDMHLYITPIISLIHYMFTLRCECIRPCFNYTCWVSMRYIKSTMS